MANYNHVTAEIISELKSIVGERNVMTDPEKWSHTVMTKLQIQSISTCRK